MEKQWVACPDFEDIYAVSSDGEVKRIVPGAGKARVGHILRPARNRKGYKYVLLCRGGKCRTAYLHVLVCRTFHGPKPTEHHQAAHRDDDKDNNCEANLYWALPLENHADRRRNGRILAGSQIGKAKLVESDIPLIRQMRSAGKTNVAIAALFGVAPNTVSGVLSGRTWGHV